MLEVAIEPKPVAGRILSLETFQEALFDEYKRLLDRMEDIVVTLDSISVALTQNNRG